MHEFYLSKKYITSLITDKKEDEGIAYDIIIYQLNIIYYCFMEERVSPFSCLPVCVTCNCKGIQLKDGNL